MRRIIITLVLILAVNAYTSAQLNKLAANIGYDYMNKKSGYVGAEYRLNNNDNKNNNGPLIVGVGTYLYGNNGKFAVAPEIHLNQTWMHFLTTELSASTKNIKPSIGLSLLGLTRIQFGYSIPIDNSDFKGFHFGFHVLLGRSAFYDEIKIF